MLSLPAFSETDFQLHSFVDYYGEIEPETEYETLRNRYYIQPELKTDLPQGVDANISANLWYQTANDDQWIEAENILREASISKSFDSFDLSIGQKFVGLGFSDAFGPLNVVNGSDKTILSLDDGYDGKRADFMVKLDFYPTFEDEINLIYIPFPRPDYEPKGVVNLSSDSLDVNLDYNQPAYLTDDAQSIYLNYLHYGMSMDVELLYAYYVDRNPGFDLSELTVSADTLTGNADVEYGRNHLFGAAVSLPLGPFVLSEDVDFNLTEDFAGEDLGVKNSYLTANTQLSGTFFNSYTQLMSIFRYTFNYDENEQFSSAIDDLSTEILEYHIQQYEYILFHILHVHRSLLREKLYLSANLGFFYSSRFYVAPRARYSLSDNLSVEIGADIWTANGTSNDLTGSDDADNFYIRAAYSY